MSVSLYHGQDRTQETCSTQAVEENSMDNQGRLMFQFIQDDELNI